MNRMIMQQKRENLDILFRRTAPEAVLESIRSYQNPIGNKNFLPAMVENYAVQTYRHYAEWNLADYSLDEVDIRYRDLETTIKESLFRTLVDYGEAVLDIKNSLPVCRLEQVLNWNITSLRLGQDLIVTAWLASRNVQEADADSKGHHFTWPAVLKTDSKRLAELFEKGLAENHFHLHGSTQSFALSWACLMNHPDYIQKFLKTKSRFKENLNPGITKGILDTQMEWKERILYAAQIRALLFERCIGKEWKAVWEEFEEFDRMPKVYTLSRKVESLRYAYGSKFEQKNRRKRCLDYANCGLLYHVQTGHHNRLLAGERSFLYHCFLLHFQGKMNDRESALLYLYILIKSHFRSEVVQNNGKTGFQNFSDYQDRKDQFFEYFPEYWTETFRLSICMAQKENHVVSLETRIMPKNAPQDMNKEIMDIDSRVKLALNHEDGETNHYYTIHFLKLKYRLKKMEGKGVFLWPRNAEARIKAEVHAAALSKYIQQYDIPRYDRKQQRVWGIDACSTEIGCRPETFAAVFRFLREESRKRKSRIWNEEGSRTQAGITYHVGEDFFGYCRRAACN